MLNPSSHIYATLSQPNNRYTIYIITTMLLTYIF